MHKFFKLKDLLTAKAKAATTAALSLKSVPKPKSYAVLGGETPWMTVRQIHDLLHSHLVEGRSANSAIRRYRDNFQGTGRNTVLKLQRLLVELYRQNDTACLDCAVNFDLPSLIPGKSYFASMTLDELWEHFEVTNEHASDRALCAPELVDLEMPVRSLGTIAADPAETQLLAHARVRIRRICLTDREGHSVTTMKEIVDEAGRRQAVDSWRAMCERIKENDVDSDALAASRDLMDSAHTFVGADLSFCTLGLECLKMFEHFDENLPWVNLKPAVEWLVDGGYSVEVAVLTVGALLWEVAHTPDTAAHMAPRASRNVGGYKKINCPLDPYGFSEVLNLPSVTEEDLREAYHLITAKWKHVSAVLVAA